MAYQEQFYTLGTVSVTNGSPTVTGTNTGWATALIKGGVFYAGGGAYPILSVESETALTLAIPFIGATATDLVYAIDRQRSQATSAIAMNDRLAQIIHEINTGNVQELNALDLNPRQIIQTDANGVLATFALAASKLLRTDGNGDLKQSDITALGLAMVALSGTNGNIPVMTGAGTAASRPIVGIVSQALGVPTGAIVEASASLTQGYLRLAGGVQICWRVTGSIPSGQENLGYIVGGSQYDLGSFAAVFAGQPAVIVGGTGSSGGGWIAQNLFGSASAWGSFSPRSHATIGGNVAFYGIAIGRWYS